jgi:hypothetical protein
VLVNDLPQPLESQRHRVDPRPACGGAVCPAHLLDAAITLGWRGW